MEIGDGNLPTLRPETVNTRKGVVQLESASRTITDLLQHRRIQIAAIWSAAARCRFQNGTHLKRSSKRPHSKRSRSTISRPR